ncbi:hypothetical protein ACJJIW_10375 [Microbulbifer sp. JMSA004]|uniref:hypothetical protein n=1 Tax=Microbulbifer sp. JMSA004 TaxID=3243370 RepID=UPI0040399F26
MKSLKSDICLYLLLAMIAFVGACADSSNNVVEPDEKSASKAFLVSLESVEVERLSNGDAVSVDTNETENKDLVLEFPPD